jgi:tetratricopeptide (TPR) repeat protein
VIKIEPEVTFFYSQTIFPLEEARSLYQKGRYSEATENCCEAILKSQHCEEAIKVLEACLTAQKKIGFAIGETEEDNPLHSKGDELYSKGDYKEALSTYIEAVLAMKHCDVVFQNLKACLIQQKKIPKIQAKQGFANTSPTSEFCRSIEVLDAEKDLSQIFEEVKQKTTLSKFILEITYKNKKNDKFTENLWGRLLKNLPPQLTELTITGSLMGEPGACSISLWLKTNTSLSKLNLSDSYFKKTSTKLIFDTLSSNRKISLTELDISNNYICHSSYFIFWLNNAKSLQKLNIGFDHCYQAKEQPIHKQIGHIIAEHTQLRLHELNLAGSHLWQRNAMKKFSGWLPTQPLVKLTLEGNQGLDYEKIHLLTESLKQITTLQEINLKGTNLDAKSHPYVTHHLSYIRVWL